MARPTASRVAALAPHHPESLYVISPVPMHRLEQPCWFVDKKDVSRPAGDCPYSHSGRCLMLSAPSTAIRPTVPGHGCRMTVSAA
jgi:hypothetical protein